MCTSLNSWLNFLGFLSKVIFVEELFLHTRNNAGDRWLSGGQHLLLFQEDPSLSPAPMSGSSRGESHASSLGGHLYWSAHTIPQILKCFLKVFKKPFVNGGMRGWLPGKSWAHFRSTRWWGAVCPPQSATRHDWMYITAPGHAATSPGIGRR